MDALIDTFCYLGNSASHSTLVCLFRTPPPKNKVHLALVWISLAFSHGWHLCFCVGLVHCLRNLQVLILVNFSLKLGLMIIFTHLKIILLQCFQFSTISSIQIKQTLKALSFVKLLQLPSPGSLYLSNYS